MGLLGNKFHFFPSKYSFNRYCFCDIEETKKKNYVQFINISILCIYLVLTNRMLFRETVKGDESVMQEIV